MVRREGGASGKNATERSRNPPVQEGSDAIAEMMERNQTTMYIRLWNPTLFENNEDALSDSYDD